MPRSCQILDLHIHNNTPQHCAHYAPLPPSFTVGASECVQLICQIFGHLHLYLKTWGWEDNNKAVHYIWSLCLFGLKRHRTKSSLSIDPSGGRGWNISANIWWIVIRRATDIYGPRRMQPNDFGDTPTSPFGAAAKSKVSLLRNIWTPAWWMVSNFPGDVHCSQTPKSSKLK